MTTNEPISDARPSEDVDGLIDGMVDRSRHPLAWAIFMQELEDARDHLDGLIRDLETEQERGEIELRIELGHVYAHLNRAWHWRNRLQDTPTGSEEFDRASAMPDDLLPT